MKRWLFKMTIGGTNIGCCGSEAGFTVLRMVAGLTLALTHGWPMLPPPEGMITGVEALGFPMPTVFAWAAKLSEFGGGLLLAAGFLTRPAAFFVLCTMSVAVFGQHARDPIPVKELAMLYGSIALAFFLAGSGRVSIDGLIRRNLDPSCCGGTCAK